MADEITAGRLEGSLDAVALQGRELASTAPTNNQVLTWNSTLRQWVPTDSSGGGGVADGQQIFDGSHVLAADFGARKLTLASGQVAFNWTGTPDDEWIALDVANQTIHFEYAVTFPNVVDASFVSSIAGGDRQLIANNGSTVALDWSDPALLTFSAGINAANLPTSNPAHVGDLWALSGTITTLTTFLAGGGAVVVISEG